MEIETLTLDKLQNSQTKNRANYSESSFPSLSCHLKIGLHFRFSPKEITLKDCGVHTRAEKCSPRWISGSPEHQLYVLFR